jgi:hypothetical protein
MDHQSARMRWWFWPVTSLLVASGYWYWALNIYAPANAVVVIASGRPRGNNSDLYARWLGTRELLLHGRDPYSPEITGEIQAGFYGRALNPQNPSDPIQQEAFVYPIYVAFLLAPTVGLPFRIVAELFRWLLLAAVVLSVPLWMGAVSFRARASVTISAMLLALSSPPAVVEFFQQNLIALAMLFLAAAAAAIVRNRLVAGGVLLACATVKPDSTATIILWFLLWAASKWRDRNQLIWTFSAAMIALWVAGETLSRHWLGRFLQAVLDYRSYGTDPSLLQVLLPSSLARVVTVTLTLLLIVLCWRSRRAVPGSDQFRCALASIAAVTFITYPKLADYNQLLLIPALLALTLWYQRLGRPFLLSRALIKAPFACLIWSWAAATALSLWSILFPKQNFHTIARLPDYTSHAVGPLTLLALMMLLYARFNHDTPEDATQVTTSPIQAPATVPAQRFGESNFFLSPPPTAQGPSQLALWPSAPD